MNNSKKHISGLFNCKPKKYKFYYKDRSFFKYNIKNIDQSLFDNSNAYKNCGLRSLSSIYLKVQPLLACVKHVKRMLKIFNLINSVFIVLVFPDFVITGKPREVRMGGGKGDVSHKVCMIKKGSLLFSITGLNNFQMTSILNPCKRKLPFKSAIYYYYW